MGIGETVALATEKIAVRGIFHVSLLALQVEQLAKNGTRDAFSCNPLVSGRYRTHVPDAANRLQ